MTRRRPMESIHWPSDSGSGGTEGVESIQWVDSRESQIHKIWCLGSKGVTHELHSTVQIYVGDETVRQFLTHYFAENGRRIQISINGSIKLLGIPADSWKYGFPFIENVQAPIVPYGWEDANTC